MAVVKSGVVAKPCCLGKSGILLAALAIPGVQAAYADTAPERSQLSYKFLDYQDGQSGWERIGVHARALSILVPVAGEWSVEGSVTSDTVSGASPAFHSQQLLAGIMREHRTGRDLRVTRYFSRGTLSVGATDSRESDYFSRGVSLTGAISTEDKNTTLNFGLGKTNDKIDAEHVGVVGETKNTNDFMIGITQVLTPSDIAQLNITHAVGYGYFSDPYKFRDNRPDSKYQTAVLGRWNHHFASLGGAGRFGYRYYKDSFDVKAHTVTAEYVQPLPHDWTVAPLLRLHAQSAASFYLDPVKPPFPVTNVPITTIQSQDQRLSAFGGVSIGFKLSNLLTQDFLIDLKYERYEQRASWYPFGKGSPGIDPFKVNILQLGLTYFF